MASHATAFVWRDRSSVASHELVPVRDQDPVSSNLEQFQSNTACCGHSAERSTVELRAITCKNRERANRRGGAATRHSHSPPMSKLTQESDLPLGVQTVSNVSVLDIHEIEVDAGNDPVLKLKASRPRRLRLCHRKTHRARSRSLLHTCK